jgi:rod shape-determining protein MreD
VRWLITALIFLLLLTVQSAAAGALAPSLEAAPNLVLILVVQLALVAPQFETVLGTWCMGLVSDLHGHGPLGVLAFTWALASLALSRIRGDLFAEHLVTRLLLVAAAAAFQELVLAVARLAGGASLRLLAALRHAGIGVAGTVLAAVVLLPLLRLALRRLFPAQKES